MEITEVAYYAGIIDGEGSIGIYWRFPHKHRDYRYITPTIQVTNTDYRLLEGLRTDFGGSIYIQREARPTRKASWHWSVAGQKALHVARTVRPFLRLKAEQADIVLGIQRVTEMKRDSLGRMARSLTIETRQANDLAVSQIRALNRRGPSLPL